MKHLISLSLKYVRRQKLRSLLMFLCITLSVFVLNTFFTYSSSLIRSAKNEAIYERGAWEVEAGDLFSKCDNGEAENVSSFEEAVRMAENHIAVDKLFCDSISYSNLDSRRNDAGRIAFYELSFDNGSSVRTQSANVRRSSGDSTIVGSYSDVVLGESLSGDAAVVPGWFSELGYKEGDRVTFTVTPVSGVIDENGENVKAVRAEIAEKNTEAAEYGDSHVFILDDPDPAESSGENDVYYSFLDYFTGFGTYRYNDLELADTEYGEPVSVTLTIAGFNTYHSTLDDPFLVLETSFDSNIDFSALDGMINGSRYGSREKNNSVYMIMNPNRLIDDDMEMLLSDIGFQGESVFDEAVLNEEITINGFVATVGLRTAQKIGDYIVFVAAYLIMVVIVWLMARFVIDNAFEISVQQRSSQFAALRIMGASRGQLTALVLAEGLFYSLTAIPVGVISSMLLCRSVFNAFRESGIPSFEFYVSPLVLLISVLLCFAAIIISSYTSAMWASRKLSPAEVLSYGKPKSTKKHLFRRGEKPAKQKRSSLRNGSKMFMVRYTLKNIFRTKKRFLISTVAMALGVIMFTFCVQLGLFMRTDIKQQLKKTSGYDFEVYIFDRNAQEVVDKFESSSNFKDVSKMYSAYFSLKNSDECEKLRGLFDDETNMHFKHGNIGIDINSITKWEYEGSGFNTLLGMTYEQFCDTECAYLALPNTDLRYAEYDANGYLIPESDSSYTPMSEYGLGETLDIGSEVFDEPVKLNGVIVSGGWMRVIVSPGYAEKIVAGADMTVTCSVDIMASVVDTKHYEGAQDDITEIEKMIGGNGYVYNTYMEHTGFRTFIKTMVKVALTLMLSVWLTGIFSMMNTINTSVLNRSGELLMMRSVGMTKRQLYGNVILESVLFAAFSALIGTAIGMLGFYALVRYASGFLPFRYTGLAITTMIASFAVNILVSLFAALPALRSLTRSIKQHIS